MPFAVSSEFHLDSSARRKILKHLGCISSAELFRKLLRLGFDDIGVGGIRVSSEMDIRI